MKAFALAFILFMFLPGPSLKICFAQGNTVSAAPVLSKAAIKSLLENFSQNLSKFYLYPEKAPQISSFLESQYKKGIYQKITDPNILVLQINKDLFQVSNDRHLRMEYDPKKTKQLDMPPVSEAEKQQQQEKGLAAARTDNFHLKKLEILSGNIGYARIDAFFGGSVEEAKPTLQAAFQFLKNTRALIIDLRKNGGGSPVMASQIQSYLFAQKMHMLDVIEPAGNKTYELFADPAKADGLTLNMPVYILTSKVTASAAEGFSYDLQSVKRATLVGETTVGAAYLSPAPYKLGQGFLANIPIARPYNLFTKSNWEAVGVKPDIAAPAEQALVQAQAAFFNDLLAKAADEKEKRKLQWHLNTLKASQITVIPEPATLNQYAGMYQGDLDFYVQDGRLFCKDGGYNNLVSELKPIADGLFVLDEDKHVQFEKDASGAYSKIKMLYRWGDTSERFRN